MKKPGFAAVRGWSRVPVETGAGAGLGPVFLCLSLVALGLSGSKPFAPLGTQERQTDRQTELPPSEHFGTGAAYGLGWELGGKRKPGVDVVG